MKRLQLQMSALSLDGGRRMQGIAYAGGVLSYHGEKFIIELDSLQLNGKQIPLLHNHDRDRHVGFGWLSREGRSLVVTGEMLNNEHAQAIITAADQGMTWQMSVHIESDRVQRRRAGDIVNGEALQEDVLMFSNGLIREVSFTPTGVDGRTEAKILTLSMPQEESSMEQEERAQLSAKIAEKEAKIAELEEKIRETQQKARLAQLQDLGVEEGRAAQLSLADEAVFAALLDELQGRQKKGVLLSQNYGTAAEKRPNPLLQVIKK